jgi:hypothetical protein
MIAAAYSASSSAQAGPIGLAVVVVLGIVVAFLGRSMNRHLAKVPKSFDKPTDDSAPDDSAPVETAPADNGQDSADK